MVVFAKVKSVQEAWDKCVALHLSKFEILKPHEKTKQTAKHIGEKLKSKGPPLAWANFKIKIKQIAHSTVHFD